MNNPITMAEIALLRQRELLEEAEYRRFVSQAIGKKSHKMGKIRRNFVDVIIRTIKGLEVPELKFPLFGDENAR